MKDEEFGMRPVAFLETDNFNDILEQINAFLDGRIPRYMYPVAYIPWTSAPKKNGIKHSRFRFAQKAAELLGPRK